MYYSHAGCPEWKLDATLQVVLNKDITKNYWTGFDENQNGCSQIVKTKYPQASFATYHVIYGETKEDYLSGALFIQYWDFYRPMVRPMLYRFVMKKSSGDEPPPKKARNEGKGNLKDDKS